MIRGARRAAAAGGMLMKGKGTVCHMDRGVKSKNDLPRLVRSDKRFEKDNMEIILKNYESRTWYHWHDYFEMEFIVQGQAQYTVNGSNYNLDRGSCYMVTPADFHRLTSLTPLVIFNVTFNDSVLTKEIYDRIHLCGQWPAITFSDSEMSFVEPVFYKLLEIYGSSPETCPMRERAMADLLEFLVILYMQKIESREVPDSSVSRIVLQAISYIKYNFKNKLTLQSVAATIPITPNYLGAKFKDQMGISFNTYLMHTRLAYAHNMLKSDKFSVEEVAYASGFGTASYFSDCFRKYYGYSPVEMKKILNIKK